MPTELEDTCKVVKDKLPIELREWSAFPYTTDEIHNAIQDMHPLKLQDPMVSLLYFFRSIGILWEVM